MSTFNAFINLNPWEILTPRYVHYPSFHLACLEGNIQIVEYDLNRNTPPWPVYTFQGCSMPCPLNFACRSRINTMNIIQLLLEHPLGHGQDVNKDASYAYNVQNDIRAINNHLSNAINVKNREVFDFLIEKGAIIHDCHLHIASISGNTEVIKTLIDAEVDVNGVDNVGESALHKAVNSEIVQKLVKLGARVNNTNNNGQTPLITACTGIYFPRFETLSALLNAGADVNIVDKNGVSALHVACQTGQLNAVELLIAYGANITLANAEGWTPLSLATSFDNIEVADFIIREINWRYRKPLLLMRPLKDHEGNKDQPKPTKLAALLIGNTLECKDIRKKIGKFL